MQTSRQHREVRNTAEFRRDLGILHSAAVGVILCRTREPYRACEALREFTFAEPNLDYRVWTITTGWQKYNRANPDAEPTCDNVADAFMAMRAIQPVTGNGFDEGVYVMFYPHYNLPKHPGMIQVVKEYCRKFAESKKRLVIVTPEGFTLPQELEDDVVILDFNTPSYNEISGIYDKFIGDLPNAKRPNFSEEEKARILAGGTGMTAHEFETALSRALVTHRAKLPRVTVDEISDVILKVKTEVVKRSEVLELMDADNMNNVGGLTALKEWLAMRRNCFSQEAKDFGVDTPKGMALIGPPGTGKSLLGKATASGLGLPLIKFDVSRVFNSLVGSSEARVRSSLKMIDGMAPCVVLFDEVDKAFDQNSGGGDSGVGKRVLGAILTWMQETKSPVFVIFTANRTAGLPAELLRKGRLDEVWSVTVPSPDERAEILGIHLRKRGKDASKMTDLHLAVEASEGYVPAELEAAVKEAITEAFGTKAELNGALIAKQLKIMTPLSEAFAEDFAAMRVWAEQNARPASITGAKSAEVATTRTRTRGDAKRNMELDG